jgi:DNA (cytosine-5)-methyltransferase 1
MEQIPIISLFCGCGGLDLGFTQAGFEVVLAVDINRTAVETYNLNHGKDIAQIADLSAMSGLDIVNLLREKNGSSPKGIIGGSPCQTFSHSNVYANSEDIRHTLPGTYAAILKVFNKHNDLDFFVFENVKGITYNKHHKDFARFKCLFESAGFKIYEGLLDAVNFGVPQSRSRVFVVGFNKDKYKDQDFKFPSPQKSPIRTVADAIRELPEPIFFERGLKPEDIPYHPNHWTMRPKSRRFSDGSLKGGQKNGRSFRVLSWEKPSWTVAYGNREIHIHPTGKRRLSVFEAMLLQGFPESYQLRGTLSDQVRQVSDAVPPPLAKKLAETIRLFL